MQTDCLDATIELCTTLSNQILKDAKVFVLEDGAQKSYTHTVTVTKKGNKEDPKVFASMMLQQCPGLSATVADALLLAFGNFTGVFEAGEALIAAVKISDKRKVGPALAKRLVTLLHPLPSLSDLPHKQLTQTQ
jgi:ERCC4-type nuclease